MSWRYSTRSWVRVPRPEHWAAEGAPFAVPSKLPPREPMADGAVGRKVPESESKRLRLERCYFQAKRHGQFCTCT